MKLSDRTISVLKNYSKMNSGIKVEAGNIITTMTPASTVVSKSVVEDNFSKGFCTFDLQRFLGVLSLFNAPDLEILDDEMRISDGNKSVSYRFASENTIVYPTPDKIEILEGYTENLAEFDMTVEDFTTVIKAANILNLPNIIFAGENGKIMVKSTEYKDPSANKFNIQIGNTDINFTTVINKDHLVFLTPSDYHVKIIDRDKNVSIARFESHNQIYWIATESLKKN